jgi:hypothetical protein
VTSASGPRLPSGGTCGMPRKTYPRAGVCPAQTGANAT